MHPLRESSAGVIAARVASITGALGRGRPAAAAEVETLEEAAAAFAAFQRYATADEPYSWWAQREDSYSAAAELTLTYGLLGETEVAALGRQVQLLTAAASGEADGDELSEVHDFFLRLARAIVAARSSSGESFSTLGQLLS